MQGDEDVSALEHNELEGSMYREFTIHILQSIHFLQNMEPIDLDDVKQREMNLPFKKPGKKLLIFDLDETLAHCVRQENPDKPPDVRLDINLASGKTLKAGFNIRPYCK